MWQSQMLTDFHETLGNNFFHCILLPQKFSDKLKKISGRRYTLPRARDIHMHYSKRGIYFQIHIKQLLKSYLSVINLSCHPRDKKNTIAVQTLPLIKKINFSKKLPHSLLVVIPALGCRCTMLTKIPAQKGCVVYPSMSRGLQHSRF